MLALLTLVLLAESRNYAILLNATKNYTNFRHTTDVQIFNNVLRKGGAEEKDILVLFKEDQVQNTRNPHPNAIRFNDGEEVRYTRLQPAPLDLDYIVNVLHLRDEKFKTLDENDNLFIFLCGHGRAGFLKICDTHFFFRGDLMLLLQKLCRRLAKVLLIIDTCEAESMVDRHAVPPNAFVVTTSLEKQSAYSIATDRRLGVSPANSFPYVFSKTKLDPEMRLTDLFDGLNRRGLSSSLTHCGKDGFKVKEFFVQEARDARGDLRPFVL